MVITCVCCQQWRLEEIIRDRMRGAGRERFYRLRQYRPLIGDWFPVTTFLTLDEAAEWLIERGIQLVPDDECE